MAQLYFIYITYYIHILGYDWLYVHPVYLMYNAKTSIEVGKWLKFFKQLGVEDGLIIEKKIHKLTPAELV